MHRLAQVSLRRPRTLESATSSGAKDAARVGIAGLAMIYGKMLGTATRERIALTTLATEDATEWIAAISMGRTSKITMVPWCIVPLDM